MSILAYALLSCNLAAIFCNSMSIAARFSSSFSWKTWDIYTSATECHQFMLWHLSSVLYDRGGHTNQDSVINKWCVLAVSVYVIELWRCRTVKRSLCLLPHLFFCFKVCDKIGRTLHAVAFFSMGILWLWLLWEALIVWFLSVITAAVIKSWSGKCK